MALNRPDLTHDWSSNFWRTTRSEPQIPWTIIQTVGSHDCQGPLAQPLRHPTTVSLAFLRIFFSCHLLCEILFATVASALTGHNRIPELDSGRHFHNVSRHNYCVQLQLSLSNIEVFVFRMATRIPWKPTTGSIRISRRRKQRINYGKVDFVLCLKMLRNAT